MAKSGSTTKWLSIACAGALMSGCALPQKLGKPVGVVDYNKIINALNCQIYEAWKYDRNKWFAYKNGYAFNPKDPQQRRMWAEVLQPVWDITTHIQHYKEGVAQLSAGTGVGITRSKGNWTKTLGAYLPAKDVATYKTQSEMKFAFPYQLSTLTPEAQKIFAEFSSDCENHARGHYANLAAMHISSHFKTFLDGYDENEAQPITPGGGLTVLATNLSYTQTGHIGISLDPKYVIEILPKTWELGASLSAKNYIDFDVGIVRSKWPEQSHSKKPDSVNIANVDELANAIARAMGGKRVKSDTKISSDRTKSRQRTNPVSKRLNNKTYKNVIQSTEPVTDGVQAERDRQLNNILNRNLELDRLR